MVAKHDRGLSATTSFGPGVVHRCFVVALC